MILGQNGHFSAHLAKIGQNEKFYQKSGRAIFLPLLSPNFMPSFRKIGWAVSEINSLHTSIHPSIHPHKGETIEPVAFAGSITYKNAYRVTYTLSTPWGRHICQALWNWYIISSTKTCGHTFPKIWDHNIENSILSEPLNLISRLMRNPIFHSFWQIW